MNVLFRLKILQEETIDETNQIIDEELSKIVTFLCKEVRQMYPELNDAQNIQNYRIALVIGSDLSKNPYTFQVYITPNVRTNPNASPINFSDFDPKVLEQLSSMINVLIEKSKAYYWGDLVVDINNSTFRWMFQELDSDRSNVKLWTD